MKILKSIRPIAAVAILLAVGACALFEDKHVSEGRRHYNYYCSQCHGEKGQGNGYNAVNLDPRPRDLTDSLEPYMAELTNEEIFHSIREGIAGAYPEKGAAELREPKREEDEEGGTPLMPYWGYTLSEQQIWELVAFVRTFHKNTAEKVAFKEESTEGEEHTGLSKPKPVTFAAPDSPEGRKMAEAGKDLYENKYSCAGCHRVNGTGGQVGPDLSRAGIRLNANWIYQWIQYPQAFRHDTKMPAFNMPEADAKAISIYLKTLRATAAESPGPPSGKGPT